MSRSVLFFDAHSGLSGDMIVAALLDVGTPEAVVDRAVAALSLPGVRLAHGHVERSGIRSRRFEVHCDEDQPERTWLEISALLADSLLPPRTRSLATAAFLRLAEAEAAVHGVPLERVHFHEVGAVDSIVDIVAAAACLDHLDADVVCSPLPMGHGYVRSRHGVLPLPAPATVHCLRGVPTYPAGIAFELVTPTGACLVASAASRFERWPAMRPRATGWGAGTRELDDRPNVLRVVLGEAEPGAGANRSLVMVETDLDDATPELLAHAVERIRQAGALDAWTSPVGMKKGRAGARVSALVEPRLEEDVVRTFLVETPTLGVRRWRVERRERPRRVVDVQTRFGPVPVKIADGDGLPPRQKPEHDACAALAVEHGVPLDHVREAALEALRGTP